MTALALYTGLHHELMARMMVGAIVALVSVLPLQRWSWPLAVGMAVTALGSLLRYTAGGLWKRSDRIRPPFPQPEDISPLVKTRVMSVHAVSESLSSHAGFHLLFVAGVAALVVAAGVSGRLRHPAALLVALLGSVLAVGLLAGRVQALVFKDAVLTKSMEVYESTTATVLLIAVAVLFGLLRLLSHRGAEDGAAAVTGWRGCSRRGRLGPGPGPARRR